MSSGRFTPAIVPERPGVTAVLARYEGACHCGALAFAYDASRPPAQWEIRACQCGFCRRHAARTTSDPEGRVSFAIADPAALRRYRFGLRGAEFLVCGCCGVYVAAVLTTPGGRFATLNVNALSEPPDLPDAVAVSYDDESPAAKRERRERRWTPVIGSA